MTIVHTATRDIDLPDRDQDRAYVTAMENLGWLYDRWSDLRASVQRGTARPWREPNLTPEQRARLDAEARAEKIERGAFTLGESPAPIHLDTLDRAIELTTTMAKLTRAMATELGHGAMIIRGGRHRYEDPLLLILYVRKHYGQLSAKLTANVYEEASRLRAGISHHFSEIGTGQVLKADCPWCDQRSLHVRTIGPSNNVQPVIRCESGTCNPPTAACGAWHRGLPIWPLHEWEWLSTEISHADHRRAA